MKPKMDGTKFGSITINGKKYEYDVLIQRDGEVQKRKKKLSKEVYGTSHIVSLDEIKFIYEDGTDEILVGTGQDGMVKLSDEAKEYLRKKSCAVTLLPTPQAIKAWNKLEGRVVGVFHVTC